MINLIEEVKERVPLRSVLDGYLGQPIRERYKCPFHPTEDTIPSLKMRPGDRSYKCWSCPASGTVIDLAMHFEGFAGSLDAAKYLAEKYLGASPSDWSAIARTPRPIPAPKPARVKPSHWRSPAWQEAAAELIAVGERNLADPEIGRDARLWLAGQGVNGTTIVRRRLGFFPFDIESPDLDLPIGRDGQPGPIRAPRGIAFPWLAPGVSWYCGAQPTPGPRWCGVNVRRFGPDLFAPNLPDWLKGRKYKTFEGSQRGFGYPFPTLDLDRVGPPAMIFEGERDALLAEQEAGDLVHAFSFGGASQTDVEPTTLAALACCPRWLVVGDRDDSGLAAVRRWLTLAGPKGVRPNLPHGKDLCDFASKGGDVRGWIESELASRGLLDFPRTPLTHNHDWSGFVAVGDEQTGRGDAYEGDLDGDLPRLI